MSVSGTREESCEERVEDVPRGSRGIVARCVAAKQRCRLAASSPARRNLALFQFAAARSLRFPPILNTPQQVIERTTIRPFTLINLFLLLVLKQRFLLLKTASSRITALRGLHLATALARSTGELRNGEYLNQSPCRSMHHFPEQSANAIFTILRHVCLAIIEERNGVAFQFRIEKCSFFVRFIIPIRRTVAMEHTLV